MYQYDKDKQLFTSATEKEIEILNKKLLLDINSNAIELDEGIILPIKNLKKWCK